VPASGGAAPSDGGLEQELTALMNAGRIQDARALLLLGSPDNADLLLFDGRVLKLQQNFAASADLLEQALRQRPSDIIIRRELAHVLFLAKRYQPAKTHLHKLLRQDPDPGLRRRYVSMLTEIRNRQKLSFGLSFALEPSTNITNGALAEYFHTPTASFRIDDVSRETSGLGVTLALTSEYAARQTDQSSLSFNFGVTATRYSVSQADRKDLYEIGVTYTVFHALSHFEIRPYWQEQMTDGQPDQTTLGISLDWTRKLSPSGDLNAGLTSERQSKNGAAKRVGTDSKLHMSYKRYLSSRAALQFGVLLEHNATGLAHQQYQGRRLDFPLTTHFSPGC
jgi:tetratricopeptide (TPR) repeat protein